MSVNAIRRASDSPRRELLDGALELTRTTITEADEHLGLRFALRLHKILLVLRIVSFGLLGTPFWFLAGVVKGFENFFSWMLSHHALHGAYDKVAGAPKWLHSEAYAIGWRRFLDWPEWIYPQAWSYEHNLLHHYFTGENRDPDQVERLFTYVRSKKIPFIIRFGLTFLLGSTWKYSYYGPSTFMHLQKKLGVDTQKGFNFYRMFNPLSSAGRNFYLQCFMPHALFFMVSAWISSLVVPGWLVGNFLLGFLLSGFIGNWVAFLTIGPNHTGSDLFRYYSKSTNRIDFLIRQITGSANYTTYGPTSDFFMGWLNYQIEHHIWPDLMPNGYQKIAASVRKTSEQFEIPYIVEPIWIRVHKMFRVCLGTDSMKSDRRQGRALSEIKKD